MNGAKRRMASTLVVILLISLIAGCRDSDSSYEFNKMQAPPNASTGSSPSEHMDISIALWDLAENMTVDDPLVRHLEKKLNITIKPVPITTENYMQQFQIWASTDQLPDIFSSDAINSQYYKNWRERGVIKAIPDDLSPYPHLAKYLATQEIEDLKENGKLYFIPRNTYDSTDYNVLDRLVIYRWDLAQQAGIAKEPETWEEFRAMLKAIVDKDPENQNITGLTSVGNLLLGGLFWLYSSPAATSDGSGSDFKWIKENGKFIPAVFSEHSVDSLKLLRDFYTEGLIDPELPATRGEMGRDKFAQGKAAALLIAGSIQSVDININQERWQKLHPGDTRFYDKIKVLKPLPSMDGNRYHALFKTFWSESYISSKVDDKKLDRILQLFDYMNSPEFEEMRHYGLKDVDYTRNGNTNRMIDPNVSLLTKYKYFSNLANLLDWDGMFKLNPEYVGISPEGHAAQQELLDYSLANTKKQNYESRLTNLSTPTKDSFTIFDSDDMIRVMISKLPVEAIWKDIVDGYKEKGLDKMIAEVNAKAKEMGME
ncbi:extracellular solute-binding protein [Cohnella endophytica]|uniref:Extracellular solute-binding protein n=1 Tax=Cohnella endophytica TaxID=2419778 RepID=A0A494XGW0_9BACL|nr:extracellular solute-binding protein [Cohnella endophytica]RKP46773.1 extracellular solute-binding protein [Cohnella endophytica]